MSANHATLLSDSLHRLATLEPDSPNQSTGILPHSRDDYGFRKSGISSPLPAEPSNPGSVCDLADVVPDPNGLGWPGKSDPLTIPTLTPLSPTTAKSTVSRLNATLEEKRVREEKMASAVRVILECIGEDPDREGLVKTPERYAQALMWMTRGYEERLAGQLPIHAVDPAVPLIQLHQKTLSTTLSSPRTMMKWSS